MQKTHDSFRDRRLSHPSPYSSSPPLKNSPKLSKSTGNISLDFLGDFMREIEETISGLKPEFKPETPYHRQDPNLRDRGLFDELFERPPEKSVMPEKPVLRKDGQRPSQEIDKLNIFFKEMISVPFSAIRSSLARKESHGRKPPIIESNPEPSANFFDAIAEILLFQPPPQKFK
jgi:hypothetical protein